MRLMGNLREWNGNETRREISKSIETDACFVPRIYFIVECIAVDKASTTAYENCVDCPRE
jgi:hypothetical protein